MADEWGDLSEDEIKIIQTFRKVRRFAEKGHQGRIGIIMFEGGKDYTIETSYKEKKKILDNKPKA